MSDLIEFTVKNPAKVTSSPYKLRAKLTSTVQDLKNTIQQEYDGHPDSQVQTLIYAGKVLRESAVLVKDFIHQNIDGAAAHSLHLVIKPGLSTPGQTQVQNEQASHAVPGPSSSGFTSSSQRGPAPQVHVPTQLQPQNAAMVAAYQAALNAYISNQNMRPGPAPAPLHTGSAHDAGTSTQPQQQPPHQQAQPQQQQQQHQHQQQQHQQQPHANQQADANLAGQAMMYPVHPPHMLAYLPVLVPNPYAALPQAWAQQQQGQQAQQQWQAGQPPPAPAHPFPYPLGMPVMFPYGVPQHQGPAMPIRLQMPGGAYPAMPGAIPNAGMRGGVGMAQGMPGGMFRMRRVPGMRVRMVRIDLKALLQVAVAAWVLYQHCPPGRFLMLLAVAALIYLTGLTPLRQMLQRLANVNLAQPGPAAAAAAAGPAAAGGANQPAPAAPRQWSFLAELQAVVVGFISSLIPGWNMNPEDAAAFAAAQQMQAAEAAREAQRGRANEQPNLHQD